MGPIIYPLKWPEYDQSILSSQQMNISSPLYWNYREIENREDAALGDYPRYVPMQVSIIHIKPYLILHKLLVCRTQRPLQVLGSTE